MVNLHELDKREAIALLEQSVYFINQVPNRKYQTLNNKNSYDLANDIDAFLNKVKKDE